MALFSSGKKINECNLNINIVAKDKKGNFAKLWISWISKEKSSNVGCFEGANNNTGNPIRVRLSVRSYVFMYAVLLERILPTLGRYTLSAANTEPEVPLVL